MTEKEDSCDNEDVEEVFKTFFGKDYDKLHQEEVDMSNGILSGFTGPLVARKPRVFPKKERLYGKIKNQSFYEKNSVFLSAKCLAHAKKNEWTPEEIELLNNALFKLINDNDNGDNEKISWAAISKYVFNNTRTRQECRQYYVTHICNYTKGKWTKDETYDFIKVLCDVGLGNWIKIENHYGDKRSSQSYRHKWVTITRGVSKRKKIPINSITPEYVRDLILKK